jgi:hypothetical protein
VEVAHSAVDRPRRADRVKGGYDEESGIYEGAGGE